MVLCLSVKLGELTVNVWQGGSLGRLSVRVSER